MSPRRGSSVRSRSRSKPGPIRTGATKAVQATARGAGAAKVAVSSRTTKVRCPHCRGMPWISGVDWPDHQRAHRMTSTPDERGAQQVTRVRARGQRHVDEVYASTRPVNQQANPGGVFGAPTRPQDRRPSPHVRVVDNGPAGDGLLEALTASVHGDTTPPDKVWGEGSGGYRDSWITGVLGALGALLTAGWTRFAAPFRAKPRARPARGDGWRWKNRTTNPGGTPVGGTPDPAPVAPVVPLHPDPSPQGAPVSTPTTTGGRGRGRGRSGSSTSSASSAAGAAGIPEAGQVWARQVPETLAAARHDAQAITEALAGLADVMLMRQNLETDRSIAASCVEPYGAAAGFIRQAAEACQEVHNLLVQRYGWVADELAKPDTPEPTYLVEGS